MSTFSIISFLVVYVISNYLRSSFILSFIFSLVRFLLTVSRHVVSRSFMIRSCPWPCFIMSFMRYYLLYLLAFSFTGMPGGILKSYYCFRLTSSSYFSWSCWFWVSFPFFFLPLFDTFFPFFSFSPFCSPSGSPYLGFRPGFYFSPFTFVYCFVIPNLFISFYLVVNWCESCAYLFAPLYILAFIIMISFSSSFSILFISPVLSLVRFTSFFMPLSCIMSMILISTLYICKILSILPSYSFSSSGFSSQVKKCDHLPPFSLHISHISWLPDLGWFIFACHLII